MEAVKLLNATRTLAEDQNEFSNLDIMDADVGGNNCMFSVWEPTEEELKILNDGGKIQLGIMGVQHPPVLLLVQDKTGHVATAEEKPEDEDGIVTP